MGEPIAGVETLDFILRVFRVFDGLDGLESGDLFWRVDDERGEVRIYVTCSDLFFWACADCEEITRDNLGLLESTAAEVRGIVQNTICAELLWCCRVRGMRPQGPYYEHLDEKLRPLFDACGPERDQ